MSFDESLRSEILAEFEELQHRHEHKAAIEWSWSPGGSLCLKLKHFARTGLSRAEVCRRLQRELAVRAIARQSLQYKRREAAATARSAACRRWGDFEQVQVAPAQATIR